MADISPIALFVGGALIIFPDPATTAMGIAIVAASVGMSALND